MTSPLRLVMDTSVLVAALRSSAGASHLFLNRAASGQYRLLLSNTLLLEYEAVLKRPSQMASHGLALGDIDVLLGAVQHLSLDVIVRHRYRPLLRDPDDEHVLETAINGQAHAIVTHNVADFLPAARRFNVQVLRPGAIITSGDVQ